MNHYLCADDVAMGALPSSYPVVKDVLANLSCLSATCVASDEDNAAVVDELENLSPACCDWKRISLLLPPHQLGAGLASFTPIVR